MLETTLGCLKWATVGFVVAFIVALITVKMFVQFLQRGKLTPFAWYRILVAPIFYFLTRGLRF